MEPLIRLRLLASQLTQNELNQFIQKIINTFGAEKIISFIFNHFLLKYNQYQQHHDDLGNIINIISNILISRQNNKTDQKNDEDILALTVDSMPSEMIKQCASYLDVADYLNFSKSNRKIYVSCNSPSKLQRLFTTNYPKYHECNLNQFTSIKCLELIPNQFNQYIASHPKQKQFYQLNSLYLDNISRSDHEHIETFMNIKCINFSNITSLSCTQFGEGHNLYDFDSFCDILRKLPYLRKLQIKRIFLTEFNSKNEAISKLLPNLSVLDVTEPVSQSVNLLRDTFMTNYSKQIVSLTYDEEKMNIAEISFSKLKELLLYDPNISINKIIENSEHLERFQLMISRGLQRVYDKETMKNMMNKLFKKCSKLQSIQLTANYEEMQKLMDGIENALFDTKGINREQMTLSLAFVDEEAVMDEVKLYISRIINALDISNINDYIIGVHVYIEGDNLFDIISDKFKETHLVNTTKWSDEYQSVIISNKDCKINGYRRRWIKYAYL